MARAVKWFEALLIVGSICSMFSPGSFAGAQPPVLPRPVEVSHGREPLRLTARQVVVVTENEHEKLGPAAGWLARELGFALGTAPRILTGGEVGKERTGTKTIRLSVRPAGTILREGGRLEVPRKADGYVLAVDGKGATIAGVNPRGVFYGITTLLQLLEKKDGSWSIWAARVRDFPHMTYRGMRMTLPRGEPRKGEISHEYFRNWLRALAMLKMNHIWLEGLEYSFPFENHPELAWSDVLTRDQVKEFNAYGESLYLNMDASVATAPAPWALRRHKELMEARPGEDLAQLERNNRANLCPSHPGSCELVYDLIDDVAGVFSGEILSIGIDEVHHDYSGARWAECPRCRGKVPAELLADYVNKMIDRVHGNGRTPIVNSTVLIRWHGGSWKDLYKAVDRIHDDNVIINNWSEGHVRKRHASGYFQRKFEGESLPDLSEFSSTDYFAEHGFDKVIHLATGGNHWDARPELREVNGKLDAYGVIVAHYWGMSYFVLKSRGTVEELVFTAEHGWSPDKPRMDSSEEAKVLKYGNALMDGIVREGKGYLEAVLAAREAMTVVAQEFVSKGPVLELLTTDEGKLPQEGQITVQIDMDPADASAVFLVFDLYDGDFDGEGTCLVNGNGPITLPASRAGNGKNFEFPPIAVEKSWLRQGANVLKIVHHRTAGFHVNKIKIVLERPRSEMPPTK